MLGKKANLNAPSVSVGQIPAGNITSMSYVNSNFHQAVQIDDTGLTFKGDLVISDTDGKNEVNVGEFVKSMQDRLCILQPNFEAMEEYPALKDAYDQYKMLEKLLMEKNNANKD